MEGIGMAATEIRDFLRDSGGIRRTPLLKQFPRHAQRIVHRHPALHRLRHSRHSVKIGV